MDLTVLIASAAAGAWLLIVVHRAGVRRRLPWFAAYVWWECLKASAQLVLWLFNHRLYFQAYWWMEVIEIGLVVIAMRESFLLIFSGFTSKHGFRFSVFGVILAVVAYSAWKAIYAPPVVGNRLTAFVIGAEFLFRWGIAGIGLLTIVLTWLVGASSNTHEDAVVTGFTLASGAFAGSAVTVSLFGAKYLFLSKYLPSMGYLVAIFLWIWAFSRPDKGIGFEELGIGPEEMLKAMRGYSQAVKRIRGSQ